jgi:hypothetical protein
MRVMTRLPGVPDSDQAKPGMAYFSGTGPAGKTCGDCSFRTYQTKVQVVAGDGTTATVWDTVPAKGCLKYKQMTGRDGPEIKKYYAACREFQEKEKPAWTK